MYIYRPSLVYIVLLNYIDLLVLGHLGHILGPKTDVSKLSQIA